MCLYAWSGRPSESRTSNIHMNVSARCSPTASTSGRHSGTVPWTPCPMTGLSPYMATRKRSGCALEGRSRDRTVTSMPRFGAAGGYADWMGVDVTVERRIERSRDEVARFAMDPANDTRWILALDSARVLPRGPGGGGPERGPGGGGPERGPRGGGLEGAPGGSG